MKRSLFILLTAAVCLSAAAASAPIEVWLTPERKSALDRITSRPRVISQETRKDGEVVSRWTNGSREWSTTNRPASVLGKKSVNAWQKKLDAKDAEKKAILDDIKAVKDKPTKKDLDAIINKHGK